MKCSLLQAERYADIKEIPSFPAVPTLIIEYARCRETRIGGWNGGVCWGVNRMVLQLWLAWWCYGWMEGRKKKKKKKKKRNLTGNVLPVK